MPRFAIKTVWGFETSSETTIVEADRYDVDGDYVHLYNPNKIKVASFQKPHSVVNLDRVEAETL